MTGIVKRIVKDKGYGFIAVTGGTEYFFHRSNFSGHYDDLVDDVNMHLQVPVEFEVVNSPRGPRAQNVSRTDYPNQYSREID